MNILNILACERQNSNPPIFPVILLAALFLYPSTLLAAGTVQPDNTLTLKSAAMPNAADGSGDDCFLFPFGNLSAICTADSSGHRIGVRASAINSFNRGQAMTFQYYEFEVDDSDGAFNTILTAQVSGTGAFNGFLAQVSGGIAEASAIVRVIDMGETAILGVAEPKLIREETLSSHRLEGSAEIGVGFSVGPQGGAAFIGGHVSVGLDVAVNAQKEVVRDSLDFGLQVLVQRGHTYRVYFEATATAKRGAMNGLSIAQFQFGNEITDVLGIDNWLIGLTDTVSVGLPSLKAETMRIYQGFPFNWFAQKRMRVAEMVDSEGNSTPLTSSAVWFQNVAASSGLPTSFNDIVAQRFNKAAPDSVEEVIQFPGLTVDTLEVMLEPDHVEIAADQTNRINEAIRLLLTPQGQRQSNFIDCSGPGNGNGNGNGNGLGCDFPSNPGQTQGQSSNSNSSGSANGFSTSDSPEMAASVSGGAGVAGLAMLAVLLLFALRRTRP